MFRWHPTRSESYWGGRPTKNGKPLPELDYYEAMFDPAPARLRSPDEGRRRRLDDRDVERRRGGHGQIVNGHKFCFGKARALSGARPVDDGLRGRPQLPRARTGTSSRSTATARSTPVLLAGSDGDPRWVLDQIDAEFDLPPDQIKEFRVQFRPYEEAEIEGIALKPRPDGK